MQRNNFKPSNDSYSLNTFVSGKELKKQDIQRNVSLLLDELEPKHFEEILRSLPGSEEVMETIKSTKNRRARCKTLLTFILKFESKDIDSIKLFVAQLKKLQMQHVLDAMEQKEPCELGKIYSPIFSDI